MTTTNSTETKTFDENKFEGWVAEEYEMLTQAVNDLIDEDKMVLNECPCCVSSRLTTPYETQLLADIWEYSNHDAEAALERFNELEYVLYAQLGFIRQLQSYAAQFIDDEVGAEAVEE